MRQTFKKTERLCSRKTIGDLFENGNAFFAYPFRVVWMLTATDMPFPARMMPVVPVRHFRRAVLRNRIRRRIREAYRLNKEELLYRPLRTAGIRLVFILQYTEREVKDYRTIARGVEESLKHLSSIAAGSD